MVKMPSAPLMEALANLPKARILMLGPSIRGGSVKVFLSIVGGTASRRVHLSTQNDTVSTESTRSPGTGLVTVTMGHFKQVRHFCLV